ncbi:MAG: pyrroline-5-carboxylate reductase [Bauldia sp.]|nr:pyrroline-5-carboxylate reductase [Bauldia sp.]
MEKPGPAADALAALTPERPLVLAGAGKMGGALLAGWLKAGLRAAALRVVDPAAPAPTSALLARVAGRVEAAPPEGLTAGALVIAVKPQALGETLPAFRPLVGPDTLVLSIAAGITLATLGNMVGGGQVVRSMPNTPAQIGQGITVAVAAPGVGDAQRALATALLSAAGSVEWVADEGLIDAVTAVSGSGPAYVFLLAETLAEAGVAVGLPAELARRLADATISGAGALLAATGDDPATLRKNVTSPNGTTAAALDVLMAKDGLAPLIRRAAAAAKKRAEELAKGG